ncbi:MAG: shikimate kinase [Acholeplasmatales bacterium]|jgi:shikimate kinase|nr:shikimate kinase [Acholeplasmatales bacterium]
MRIYLIGLPGVGKTTIGKFLNELTAFSVFDVDKLIEQDEKKEILEIFNVNGESYFRDLESNKLKELLKVDKAIICCGGGIVERLENKDFMDGLIIYLKGNLDLIKSRVNMASRPLLKTISLEDLYERRGAKYEYFANVSINLSDTSRLTAQEIYMYLRKNSLL